MPASEKELAAEIDLTKGCCISSRDAALRCVADRLDQKQASISKAENRGDDIHVRTLKKLIQALGGKLSIRAVFPDGMERELELEEV